MQLRLLIACSIVCVCSLAAWTQDAQPRARDLGVPFDGTPGPLNAITDVAGVEVGYKTLISGEGRLVVGKRTRPHRSYGHSAAWAERHAECLRSFLRGQRQWRYDRHALD